MDGSGCGCGFPFEFSGEAMAGPAGIGIGLKKADVRDGGVCGLLEREGAAEGEERPVVIVIGPVKRGAPAVLLDGIPAGGEPEFRASIATIGDETGKFTIGDEARGEREGPQPLPVAR